MFTYWLERLARIWAALAMGAFFTMGSWVLWSARSVPVHVNGVLTRAEAVESKLYASAGNLDKATAAWSQSARSQAEAITDLATDARGALSSVDQLIVSLRSNSQAINDNLASLRETIDQATGLTGALAADARMANQTLQAAPGFVEAYTRSGNDLDALLRSPRLSNVLGNLDETTARLPPILTSWQNVSADFYAFEHPVMNPPPCNGFACRLKRYALRPLFSGSDLLYHINEGSELFRALPVRISH